MLLLHLKGAEWGREHTLCSFIKRPMSPRGANISPGCHYLPYPLPISHSSTHTGLLPEIPQSLLCAPPSGARRREVDGGGDGGEMLQAASGYNHFRAVLLLYWLGGLHPECSNSRKGFLSPYSSVVPSISEDIHSIKSRPVFGESQKHHLTKYPRPISTYNACIHSDKGLCLETFCLSHPPFKALVPCKITNFAQSTIELRYFLRNSAVDVLKVIDLDQLWSLFENECVPFRNRNDSILTNKKVTSNHKSANRG